MQKLTPELLLTAYSRGMFPMADSAETEDVYWYDPEMRGQLPIRHLHVPRRLRKTLRKNPYQIGFNIDFPAVIEACALPAANRPETWINNPIREAFQALHRAGYAHSVEAWYKNELVGGLYGLAIGGAFFGESMFSTATDASKICLVHLTAHLARQGFVLLDTQFINEHLKQFGVYELPRDEYLVRLTTAIHQQVQFVPESVSASGSEEDSDSLSASGSEFSLDPGSAVSFSSDKFVVDSFLQSMTQTS
ncbi:MAG: leucyl/phenylalanyl-tRNA--protein transferase [Pseudomonadota bacterium]